MKDREADLFVVEALFSTVTNVNFDQERLRTIILKAGEIKERIKNLYLGACRKVGENPETLDGPAAWTPAGTMDEC